MPCGLAAFTKLSKKQYKKLYEQKERNMYLIPQPKTSNLENRTAILCCPMKAMWCWSRPAAKKLTAQAKLAVEALKEELGFALR